MKKKHIVFDVDRTMVDSFMPEILSLSDALKQTVKKEFTKEELFKSSTLPTNVFLESIGLTSDEIKEVYHNWDIEFKKYHVICFKGIKELIKNLVNYGYDISIITSRTTIEFNELLDELSDIIDLFKVIVTSDLINNHKPSRDSMDYLCNKLNCNENDIIYIGDSIIDKEFAKNSNCSFISACWDNKELIDEKFCAINPSDIIRIISIIEKV